jgi:hypothetical protein
MEDKNKKSVPLQRDYSHSQLGRAATFAISEASASRRPPSRKLLKRHRARAASIVLESIEPREPAIVSSFHSPRCSPT